MNSTKSLMILSVLAVIITITSTCFITNCPPGGKRSSPSRQISKRQCTRCGPQGSGRCFGPNICCGSTIGCHINNEFTAICSTEDYTPVPCYNTGKSCANGKGVCAIDSTCCTSGSCFNDNKCQSHQMKILNDDNNSIETLF